MYESQSIPSRPVIVLAEDEPHVRAVTARILEATGYEVLSGFDGRDALRIIRQVERPIALVMADVIMPVMTGVELCQAIKTECPGVPLLFTSGYAPPELRERGYDLARHPFVRKPYSSTTLIGQVRAAIAGQDFHTPPAGTQI